MFIWASDKFSKEGDTALAFILQESRFCKSSCLYHRGPTLASSFPKFCGKEGRIGDIQDLLKYAFQANFTQYVKKFPQGSYEPMFL